METVLKITPLKYDGVDELVGLVNSAYRGEDSKKGWTTEADLIEGSLRIDADSVKELMKKEGTTILTCSDGITLLGCVNLQQEGDGIYLGMLSVSPNAQGLGIGKKLLEASELHAKAVGCNFIFMTVIDVRHELIAWYERHGYARTGEKKPFPVDETFGKPRQPLVFDVLKKII